MYTTLAIFSCFKVLSKNFAFSSRAIFPQRHLVGQLNLAFEVLCLRLCQRHVKYLCVSIYSNFTMAFLHRQTSYKKFSLSFFLYDKKIISFRGHDVTTYLASFLFFACGQIFLWAGRGNHVSSSIPMTMIQIYTMCIPSFCISLHPNIYLNRLLHAQLCLNQIIGT